MERKEAVRAAGPPKLARSRLPAVLSLMVIAASHKSSTYARRADALLGHRRIRHDFFRGEHDAPTRRSIPCPRASAPTPPPCLERAAHEKALVSARFDPRATAGVEDGDTQSAA